jgi:hypothetical protein
MQTSIMAIGKGTNQPWQRFSWQALSIFSLSPRSFIHPFFGQALFIRNHT